MPNRARDDDAAYMTAAERALAEDCRAVQDFARVIARAGGTLVAQAVAGRMGWRRSRALAALQALERDGSLRRVAVRGGGSHWAPAP
jgi:hypothetical protein